MVLTSQEIIESRGVQADFDHSTGRLTAKEFRSEQAAAGFVFREESGPGTWSHFGMECGLKYRTPE